MRTTRPKVYVEPHGRGWRGNYRVNGDRKRYLLPTEEQARFAVQLVESALAARPDLDPWNLVLPLVEKYAAQAGLPPPTSKSTPLPSGLKRQMTVQEWYEMWLPMGKPECRAANYKDYQHNATYFLPHLGHIQLSKLTVHDLVRCRAALLTGGRRKKLLSTKTVKNILMGTRKRMLRDARSHEVMTNNPFDHPLFREWPRTNNPVDEGPEPKPFTVEQKDKVIDTVRRRYWGNPKTKGLFAYVFTLLHIPFRPSEGAGLNWGDIDLANARAHVRRSYRKGAMNPPKTRSSRRTVELPDEVVEVLRQIQPLRVGPDDPVFVNSCGDRLDPANFDTQWNGCLRVAGVTARGLYACKDTCITIGRLAGASWAFLEAQSGVREATLIKHYYAFLPNEVPDEFEKIRSWEQGRREASQPQPHQPQTLTSKTAS